MFLNKVILMGNVGDDPFYLASKTGKSGVCTFSICTNSSYKSKTGEEVKQTEWHRVVCFGKIAESANSEIKKGKKVYVEGSIKNSNFIDKNDVKRYRIEIICTYLVYLDRSDENSQNDNFDKPDDEFDNVGNF